MSTTSGKIQIELFAAAEAKLRDRAGRLRIPLELFLQQLLERDAESGPSTFENEIVQFVHRTPEEIEKARAEVRAASRGPLPIPSGRSFEEYVQSLWPGEESEEDVRAALEKLS